MAKSLAQRLNYLPHFCFCAGLIFLLILSALNFWVFFKPNTLPKNKSAEVLGVTEEKVLEQNFWTDFLIGQPSYLPGWLELVKLEIKKGNLEAARVYLEKAKSINPNSDEVLELELSFFEH